MSSKGSGSRQSPSSRRQHSGTAVQKPLSSRLLPPLFEQAADAMVILDDRGDLVDVNAAACRLLGLSRLDLLGRNWQDFSQDTFDLTWLRSAAATDQNAQNAQSAQNAQNSQNSQLQLFSATGQRRTVEYSLTLDAVAHHHLLIWRDRTQQQDVTETELQRQRQRQGLVAEVTLKIRQSLQLSEILRATVTEVQRILQADRVLIYQVLPNGTGKPISESVLPQYPAILGMEFPEEVFPPEYQQLYAQGRVRAIVDVHDPAAGLADCLVEFVEQFQIQSKLIVPILQPLNPPPATDTPPQLWGLLIAHQCSNPRQWVEFELELMQQLADQISIALAQAQLLEHLEEIVESRTAELKQVNRSLQQEINDRMQAEEALRHSEEQLRLITNALPVLIAYVDEQQRYCFNNQAYADWLGQVPAEIQGWHLQQVWGADSYRRMQPHVATALAGTIVTYEHEITTAEHRLRSVSVTYIPHRDEQGSVRGFFALASDISDRKAIERIKDELISVVSHELRTPLTSLHSALKILATGRLGTLSGDGQQMLAIADENTERLVRLVNNVLDLQRIESGNVTMDRQQCNAADVMIQAMEAMQPMAQQHGVRLSTQPVDIQIWADADYIVQALTNLLSNAIKFSGTGSTVWLTVEQRSRGRSNRQASGSESGQSRMNQTWAKSAKRKGKASAKSRDLSDDLSHGAFRDFSDLSHGTSQDQTDDQSVPIDALFQVRDQGQGIPADKLESIFERFQQVDSSDSRKKGGTGLGLTICRKIIEQHDGKIWAESTLGNGSTFCFTLPALSQ